MMTRFRTVGAYGLGSLGFALLAIGAILAGQGTAVAGPPFQQQTCILTSLSCTVNGCATAPPDCDGVTNCNCRQ